MNHLKVFYHQKIKNKKVKDDFGNFKKYDNQAASYVVDYNKVGEVEIFGYYTSPTIESAIRKNVIRSTIVIDTNQMGRVSVEALNEYRESGYVSEFYLIDASLVSAETLSGASEEGGQDDAQEDE